MTSDLAGLILHIPYEHEQWRMFEKLSYLVVQYEARKRSPEINAVKPRRGFCHMGADVLNTAWGGGCVVACYGN